MNKQVWKYQLPLEPPYKFETCVFLLAMPVGAKIIRVATQDGLPFLWAEVDVDSKDTYAFRFACIWTGHGQVPDGHDHLATVEDGTGIVWHVYRNRGDSDYYG